MVAKNGYVWILPAWFTEHWWMTDKFNMYSHFQDKVPCSSAEMLEAVQGHFFLNTAYLGERGVTIVGNCTVDQWFEQYKQRMNDVVNTFEFHLKQKNIFKYFNYFILSSRIHALLLNICLNINLDL